MPEIETMQSRILVIDDNPAIYEDFCKVLSPGTLPSKALLDLASTIFDEVRKPTQTESYQIDFAPRGQDGVKKVQAALEEGWPYVIAFVDMRMPNGWGGLETIKNLWLTAPQLQIVLCTAYSDYSWSEIREQLSRRDRFLILKKPFDNIEVQQMVETLINRQQAENLLLENRNLLQTAQEIARIGHYTLNHSSQQVTRSESLNAIFEIDPDRQTSFDDFCGLFAPDYQTLYKSAVLNASKTHAPFELICPFEKGSPHQYAWCLTAGHWEFSASNEPVKFVGTIQDITQTYELQNQLRLLDACISQANEVVIITDARPKSSGGPKIVYVNDQFGIKTGYTREFAIGKTMDILYGEMTKITALEAINKGLTNLQPVRIDLINYDTHRNESWVDLNMSPIRDKAGQVTHWLWIQRDISNQRVTFDALTEKEYGVVKAVARNSDITLKEIADQLHISEHTLRNHLASIYDKLDVKNRLELYVFCSKMMDELN